MRVLGLTGYLASGKDTAGAAFRECGVDEIDVDRVGHLVLAENLDRVEALFGQTFRTAGGPDRGALGRHVFAAPERLARLEALLHPLMVAMIAEKLPGLAERVVINAALLYRMGLERLCDGVLRITAPDALLLDRALARGRLTRDEAARRLALQKAVNPPPLSSEVQIENTSTVEDLQEKVALFSTTFFGEVPHGRKGTKWPPGDVCPEP